MCRRCLSHPGVSGRTALRGIKNSETPASAITWCRMTGSHNFYVAEGSKRNRQMSDDDGPTGPPDVFKLFAETSEQAVETQQELLRSMLGGGSGAGMDMNQLGAMSQTATFKTRVQSGGRISIPDAERETLDIEEGDIVQAVVFPVKRKRDD
jgi:hypothetical protein